LCITWGAVPSPVMPTLEARCGLAAGWVSCHAAGAPKWRVPLPVRQLISPVAAEVRAAHAHHEVVGVEIARSGHELPPGLNGTALVGDASSRAWDPWSARTSGSSRRGNPARVKKRQVGEHFQIRDSGVEFVASRRRQCAFRIGHGRRDFGRGPREPRCSRGRSFAVSRARSASVLPRRNWRTAGCRCPPPWRRRQVAESLSSANRGHGEATVRVTRATMRGAPSLPGAVPSRPRGGGFTEARFKLRCQMSGGVFGL